MDSNKNILENLVEAQTKSVNNLVETSKKVQDSFLKGNVMDGATDIYKSWLENQKNIIEGSVNGNKNNQSAKEETSNSSANATDLFSNWMNSQMQFGKTWMENLSKLATPAPAFPSSPMEMFNEASKAYQQWSNLFSNVLNHTNGQLGNYKNMFSGIGNMNNSFSQMLNSNSVFLKMYEMWQPVMQQAMANMQNGANMESMMKAFNPEKLRETMDSVFQFASPEKFKEIYEQFNSISNRLHNQQTEMQQQWAEQMKQMGSAFPDGLKSINAAYHNNPYVKQMEQAFAPLTRLMPAGKEKEAFDAWMEVKDKFATYWTKYNEMQYIIYTTGIQAMEKVMENVLASAKETKSLPDFKEVYNQWMNQTEKLMIDTFGGDEFSRVQGELLTTGSEIKQIIEKQMERTLEGLPLVPRSEADEMAQTIHDLKARVRNLEKELRDKKSDEMAVASTDNSAKKTAKK